MQKDEIVEEVRRVRNAYAAKFDYDLNKIFKDLKKQEEKSKRKFVSLKPKTPERTPVKVG